MRPGMRIEQRRTRLSNEPKGREAQSQEPSSQKGSGASRERRRRTQASKHVTIDAKRPHITRGAQAAEMPFEKARTRNAGRAGGVKKDSSARLDIIPLGGLDGIGKNMTAFVCGDDMILVDAGLMFPDDNHPGIDLILPDYTYVLEHEDKLRGIIITHGHEDHTGSLPYLMKDLSRKVPIYATKLTLGLIEGKFAEHRVKARLCEIHAGDEMKLGSFLIDFFAVNHSIPGAVGVFMQTPAGNVMHTGDFKLDQTPIDGVHTDFAALAHFSEIGVDLLLSDSTNSMKSSFTPSEAEVGKALRSMIQNTDIARRLGYLHIADDNLLDAYDLKDLPPERVVIMCTGSQGEPLSALARIANGEHRTIDIDRGDTVIISATPVPGNEKAVTRVTNSLAKIGCDVYDKSRALVHVSGHAGAEELKIVLSIVKPRAFMPVHGEAAHLRAHARLGEAVGVDSRNIFICENGDTLTLTTNGVRRGEPVESGIVFVDGLSVGDTTRDVLDERTTLSESGLASIACAVDPKGRKVLGDVRVEMRGITGGDVSRLRAEAVSCVEGSLRRGLERGKRGRDLEKLLKDALLSLLWERTKQRPMVIASIIEP